MNFDVIRNLPELEKASAKVVDLKSKAAPEFGYGTDPNLTTPVSPWPLMLTPMERDVLGILSDILLPETDKFPSPTAIGIVDFLDQWASAPYPQNQDDYTVLTRGVVQTEAFAVATFGTSFVKLSKDNQVNIVDILAANPSHENIDRVFFVRLRYLVTGGYFTSAEGLKAIGYIGNAPLTAFPGVPAEVMKWIDEQLAKLGL